MNYWQAGMCHCNARKNQAFEGGCYKNVRCFTRVSISITEILTMNGLRVWRWVQRGSLGAAHMYC